MSPAKDTVQAVFASHIPTRQVSLQLFLDTPGPFHEHSCAGCGGFLRCNCMMPYRKASAVGGWRAAGHIGTSTDTIRRQPRTQNS